MWTTVPSNNKIHMGHIILFHYTATIAPPGLTAFNRVASGVTFVLPQATAAVSERYIFSFERTDLGVPLEVEFEEIQSSGNQGDNIFQNASAPGAVYDIKIWSISNSSFSSDSTAVSTTLTFDDSK